MTKYIQIFFSLAWIHENLGLKIVLQVFHHYQFLTKCFKSYKKKKKSTIWSQNSCFQQKIPKVVLFTIKILILWLQNSFPSMMRHFLSSKKVEVLKKKIELDFAFYSIILKYSDDWFYSAKSGKVTTVFGRRFYVCWQESISCSVLWTESDMILSLLLQLYLLLPRLSNWTPICAPVTLFG